MFKFLLLVGLGLGSFAIPAAQEPQYSCTESRDVCYDQTMHDPSGRSDCDSMHRMCMRTGHWVGSKTKVDYGPRRKN
jgi:u-PAR/Ly-6 domain